ncbi:FlgN protein [Halanaerobium saccharolyticum]|uniref:FlgN protein n=1 Tax=Halanaerobium saccharolyticum TaxID=43595 RepID=A0A4R7ZAQ4_9FIRM|nr:flagellar protein FlgN [Halanaerobium saccharolyticum]RAK08588.1 FlgN protein [Halanaerobium saccharolyticum]TDW07268.1 FlgN protein [Halanaerobium saccharolyticum]TDX60140.1 FlgN protein [Halanaerobium saccharolyticum]
MSEKLKKDLLNILKEEKALYQKLFEIAEEKNEALVNNDTDKLMEIVENDREVIADIEAKDKERNDKIQEIKDEFEIELEKNSYSSLIEKLPEGWGEDLNPIREELIDLTDDFHNLNEQNQKLLEQAIDLNQTSFETIVKSIKDQDTTYSKTAKDKKEQPRIINKQG